MKARALFFDLDGTLVDTENQASEAVREAFERWGLTLEPEDSQAVVGRTWTNALRILSTRIRLPMDFETALEEIRTLYRKNLLTQLKVIPGAVECVRALSATYSLALVSGSCRQDIEAILSHLGILRCFDPILGEEDYREGKPSPEGYLKAAQLKNLPPRDILIFEDSEPGIQAALAGGFKVAAISCANHFGHDQSRAHWKITDFRNIDAAWVESL